VKPLIKNGGLFYASNLNLFQAFFGIMIKVIIIGGSESALKSAGYVCVCYFE
jgi:hypothetical protein